MVALKNDNREISDLFIRTGRIQNIVMALIFFGFIVFGKQFIALWAGEDYAAAYPITLLFFVALYVPLIQNLGITILQARNQMKFRSLLYIVIASIALIVQYFFAKLWGGIGCAIAISGALLLGQGLILNIYYKTKQGLAIGTFWLQILKMNIIPMLVSIVAFYLTRFVFVINSWTTLFIAIVLYAISYIVLFSCFSMNRYERDLLFGFIIKGTRK